MASLLFTLAPRAASAQAPVEPRAPRAPGAPSAPSIAKPGIVSSQISISKDDADMTLELSNGRRVDMAIRNGRIMADGKDLGEAQRGATLDRSWRDLLNRAMDTPANDLPALFNNWRPPASGSQLHAALSGIAQTAALPATPGADASTGDSLNKLNARIEELQRKLDDEQDGATAAPPIAPSSSQWTRPFRNIWRGLSDIIATLITYAVLFGIGFAVVFFGGRKYLEGVADTARRAPMRAGMVGLAASFLVLPVFVLGIIVLLISIVGIPALLAWIPLFPVAVVCAVLLGYLGVAHAAGEALAERRFYGSEWFTRANSYYFLLTGLGLLVALFLAGDVVQMAGPWLGFIHGTLTFLAVVLTWAAATVGLGAVLISRGGTRPLTVRLSSDPHSGEVYAEETHA
jgi:hypothetical protein